MKEIVPGIFETFNARALDPQQVASTFVPSDHFKKLIKRNHTLIVGPRGSGKTTLLKMLQSQALEAWRHSDADLYKSQIDFTGVFIAADQGWNEQLKSLGQGKLDATYSQMLGVSAFTTHVLRSLVNAIIYRIFPPNDQRYIAFNRINGFNKEKEKILVNELASSWYIGSISPSLLSLKYALTARLSKIKEISSEESILKEDGRAERFSRIEFLHLNFLQSASLAVEILGDLTENLPSKWALLFDELELAPTSIKEELFKSLRSVDDRFLFKLSVSPYNEDINVLGEPTSAMVGHDYDEIALWFPYKESGYEFCNALFQSMVKARGLENIDPQSLFGKSEFETSSLEWREFKTAYTKDSKLYKRFLHMSLVDKTFKNYLDGRGIDIQHIQELPADERAADIRKVTTLLAVRSAFRFGDSSKGEIQNTKLRSRKRPVLYTGAKSLFALVEGNPRLFIGVIGCLLDMHGDFNTKIGVSRQAGEIERIIHRFRALLKTLPSSVKIRDSKPRGVLDLLDHIGDYFFKSVVLDDFNPDPVLSFTVDSHANQDMLNTLGKLLNAGAIIYVPSRDNEDLLSNIVGKRFRISYLLAPHYKIPMILGRSISLNAILSKNQDCTFFNQAE